MGSITKENSIGAGVTSSGGVKIIKSGDTVYTPNNEGTIELGSAAQYGTRFTNLNSLTTASFTPDPVGLDRELLHVYMDGALFTLNIDSITQPYVPAINPNYTLRVMVDASQSGRTFVIESASSIYNLDGTLGAPKPISMVAGDVYVFDIVFTNEVTPLILMPIIPSATNGGMKNGGDLGDANLNTILDNLSTHSQNSASLATAENNYPAQVPGVLNCYPYTKNGIMHEYITMQGTIYTRLSSSITNPNFTVWVNSATVQK